MTDLLATDVRRYKSDRIDRSHDLLLAHKDTLFVRLREHWANPFGLRYEVRLYDLAGTYLECDNGRKTSPVPGVSATAGITAANACK